MEGGDDDDVNDGEVVNSEVSVLDGGEAGSRGSEGASWMKFTVAGGGGEAARGKILTGT